MGKNLSKILFILAVCSIPIGFLIDHDHASFWWHRIPSLDVVVGGVGTFFGPIVGAVAFLLIHDYLQVIFTRWELVVGLILILFILFFNQGIVGAIENRVASYRERKALRSERSIVKGV